MEPASGSSNEPEGQCRARRVMLCRMPDDQGTYCMAWFSEIGEYVRHLIRDHWPQLVKVRDAMEKGEV